MLTNALKNIIDIPSWEPLKYFPKDTPALSAITSSIIAGDRYMYAISASTFWRYDIFKDTWQQLQTPNTAPLGILGLGYVSMGIYYGKIIRSLSNTTVQVAGFSGRRFNNHYMRIVNGSGVGQQRLITSSTNPIIHDQGVATAVTAGTTPTITDNTKKWEINQWSGYHCKLSFNTGSSQYRKVLYNNENTLTFGDPNWQQLFPAGDAGWSAQTPYAIPVITAGSQTHYTLESTTLTLDSPWTTPPDDSSLFSVVGGVITLISTAATTPFYTVQAYDILSDTWTNRTAVSGPIFSAAPAVDLSTVCMSELPTPFDMGVVTTSTGAGARIIGIHSVITSTGAWNVDQYTNFRLYIVSGTGAGLTKRIVGNTSTGLEVASPFELPIPSNSQYTIQADIDVFYAQTGGLSSLLQYSVFSDQTVQGSIFNYGTARNLAFKPMGLEAIGVTTATKATNAIVAISPTPAAGGTGYVVGDILTVTGGSGTAKVMVTGTEGNGIVTGLSLNDCGSGYTGGVGISTSGGTGSLCTITIAATGTVGVVTTAINHAFKPGDNGFFSGDALWVAAGLYGMGIFPVLAVPSLTVVHIYLDVAAAPPAGNAVAAASQSVTQLVDSSASWTPNEHVGKIVQINLPGSTGAATTRRITANTATTLTLQSATTLPVNGTHRYIIHDIRCFGRAVQYKVPTLSGTGYATSGTSASLTDSTKNWRGNQWAGYKLRIIAGTGLAYNDITISSNTATTLTLVTPGFTPDTTTKYCIMDTFGILTNVTNSTNATLTDTTKNWTVNQWAGKQVRINSGTGNGFEKTITSNTATTLTLSGVYTTPPLSNESTYCILAMATRGAGCGMKWLHGTTHNPGRFMASMRGGGANTGDLYDIATETWDVTYVSLPQSETYTTGSMMAYDNHDKIYMQKDATGRVYAMNVLDGDVESAGTVPYGMGVALIGQRMSIVETVDNLRYLYVLRHTGAATGTEMFRVLLY